jgi:siderophore synthetase component
MITGTSGPSPDAICCQALLNCLIREVSAPEGQIWEDAGHLIIRLPRASELLRARMRRPSAGIGPRLDGQVEVPVSPSSSTAAVSAWRPIGSQHLARLVAAELSLASGTENTEFTAQVDSSGAAVTAFHHVRSTGATSGDDTRIARFLRSEQSLIAGHRFHPTPKARHGAHEDWLAYAPEAGARFPLRFFGVRADVLAQEGDTTQLDQLGGPAPAAGYRALPAHPWQVRLLAQQPWFGSAVRDGLLADLGPGDRDVVPTSSVRTVYDPVADVFCKFSLNVRLSNCLRKSAWYELAGSVLLNGLLTPVFDSFGPAAVLLGEPGYRTVALATREAYEGMSVIVRTGVAGLLPPDVTPLLAASLIEPAAALSPGGHEALFDGRDAGWLLGWWRAYLRLLVPPVLTVFFEHGIVLEPHLQNVLVCVDTDGWPAQVVFRDLEGVKLVQARHAALLGSLPSGIAAGLGYDTERGWNRVAYCLLVNHLAEIAAAIADRFEPDGTRQDGGAQDGGRRDGGAVAAERALWDALRAELASVAAAHGWPPQLRAVLAGVPLPAKANLQVRWARAADRDAGYVRVPNPLRPCWLHFIPPAPHTPARPCQGTICVWQKCAQAIADSAIVLDIEGSGVSTAVAPDTYANSGAGCAKVTTLTSVSERNVRIMVGCTRGRSDIAG